MKKNKGIIFVTHLISRNRFCIKNIDYFRKICYIYNIVSNNFI